MTRFVRVLGAVLGALIGLQLAASGGPANPAFSTGPAATVLLVAWLIAWLVVGFLFLPYVTIVPASWLIRKVQELSTGEFVTAVAGLLIGLLMGLLLGLPLSGLPQPYGSMLPIAMSVVLGLGMLGLTVAKRHDLAEALTGVGLLPEGTSRRRRREPGSGDVVVDTSVLIDGRVRDIVAGNFLSGTLVVPRFVLGELQGIADSSDANRRNRGRRGLGVLEALQKDERVRVEVTDDDAGETLAVDARLVALARARGAVLLTNDFNLDRVAQVQGVRVMNVHQLANALRPTFLPGEEVRIRVTQEGKEPGQGVGYLDDGTMIVVEGGKSYLDREIDVTVTRTLQTVAGRMVFAQPRPQR